LARNGSLALPVRPGAFLKLRISANTANAMAAPEHDVARATFLSGDLRAAAARSAERLVKAWLTHMVNQR
jgi:hypothetical protein